MGIRFKINRLNIKISAIAKDSGVSSLNNIINENPDGQGRPATLADKHVPKLSEVIESIRKSSSTHLITHNS